MSHGFYRDPCWNIGNVDNTSDFDKPISKLQAAYIDAIVQPINFNINNEIDSINNQISDLQINKTDNVAFTNAVNVLTLQVNGLQISKVETSVFNSSNVQLNNSINSKVNTSTYTTLAATVSSNTKRIIKIEPGYTKLSGAYDFNNVNAQVMGNVVYYYGGGTTNKIVLPSNISYGFRFVLIIATTSVILSLPDGLGFWFKALTGTGITNYNSRQRSQADMVINCDAIEFVFLEYANYPTFMQLYAQ